MLGEEEGESGTHVWLECALIVAVGHSGDSAQLAPGLGQQVEFQRVVVVVLVSARGRGLACVFGDTVRRHAKLYKAI
jgi:hypothetical protein